MEKTEQNDFKNKPWRSFGYAMFSKQQCLEMLDYRKIEHREPSWIDEASPNAIHIAIIQGRKIPLNSLVELQKLVQEIDR